MLPLPIRRERMTPPGKKGNEAGISMPDRDEAGWHEPERSIRPVTDKEFAQFQKLIYQEAGIYLSPVKKELFQGRLNRRLRELGLKTFGEYYRLLNEGDEEERIRLLDSISTNETHFFREPKHFEFLEQRVFPEWKTQAELALRTRWIRVWSAASSTGEEPYSLAMILLEHFPPSAGWGIEILASDLSTRVLERAQTGIWPIEKAEEIPKKYLKTYMLKGVRKLEGKMKAGAEIRSVVRFERINLNEKIYAATGEFDLIFCRNVLIYFNSESKTRVINRLFDYLAPTGYLFLGHSETLNGLTLRARSVHPTVYVHIDEPKS